jgi:hypothetical protein
MVVKASKLLNDVVAIGIPRIDAKDAAHHWEACAYMTSMDKKRELRDHWQRVCKLILAKADVPTVGRTALFMDAKPDLRAPGRQRH